MYSDEGRTGQEEKTSGNEENDRDPRSEVDSMVCELGCRSVQRSSTADMKFHRTMPEQFLVNTVKFDRQMIKSLGTTYWKEFSSPALIVTQSFARPAAALPSSLQRSHANIRVYTRQ